MGMFDTEYQAEDVIRLLTEPDSENDQTHIEPSYKIVQNDCFIFN